MIPGTAAELCSFGIAFVMMKIIRPGNLSLALTLLLLLWVAQFSYC